MNRLAALGREAGTFLRQPLFIQLWFLPIWIMLGIGKALIFTLSFRRLAPRLGCKSGIAPWVPLLSDAQEQRALMIGRAVRLTAKYTLWGSNCFPQAIAARVLLGLYGLPYALYFGLLRDPNDAAGIKAHAWVAAARMRVTGGLSFCHFTAVDLELALRRAAADFVFDLPEGPETCVGDGGVRRSGGERQRIALARALLKQPSLLILDEATSALDRENEALVREAIEHLHGDLTLVIIGHRLAALEHADQVVVLDSGRVAVAGTWGEVRHHLGEAA